MNHVFLRVVVILVCLVSSELVDLAEAHVRGSHLFFESCISTNALSVVFWIQIGSCSAQVGPYVELRH